MTSGIALTSSMEFFKQCIDEAMDQQRLESSEDSAFYLVRLLATFVRPERVFARAGVEPGSTPAEIFLSALACDGARQRTLLKLTGDVALFVSGFLAESLPRRRVDAGYYVQLGGTAYGELGSAEAPGPRHLFSELATKFTQFADVLAEVSERCAVSGDTSLLRLYERWLATGSRRSAKILRRQGILVVPSSQAVN